MLNTIEILQVLKIVRGCCITQLKLDNGQGTLGRKSESQIVIFFISVQTNKPWFYNNVQNCKKSSRVKVGEEVLMDCDYPN